MMRNGVHGSALPGFSTSGIFSAIAGTHSEWTPGELLGSTTPSASARGKKLIALRAYPAGVEHVEIEAARQAVEHVFHLASTPCGSSAMLRGTIDVRHAGRRRHLAHVVLRRLRRWPPSGSVSFAKELGRARAISQTARRREMRPATALGLVLIEQIAADQADVGLAHSARTARACG